MRTVRRWGPAALIVATGPVVLVVPPVVQVIMWAVWAPAWAWALCVAFPSRPWVFVRTWIIAATWGTALSFVPPRSWPELIGAGISLAVAIVVALWRRTRNRRKAIAAWGARELARLADMTATLRDRRPRRPVLAPGGAA